MSYFLIILPGSDRSMLHGEVRTDVLGDTSIGKVTVEAKDG